MSFLPTGGSQACRRLFELVFAGHAMVTVRTQDAATQASRETLKHKTGRIVCYSAGA